MIQITYNGVNITGSVSVNLCYHDMYAGGMSDTLHLRANDVEGLWDSWGPAPGDEIRVDYDTINTGTMFLVDAIPHGGYFDIHAQSAPPSGYVKQYKAWQRVRLLQIGEEIAERHGLEFSSYGAEDQLYPYILQDGVGDFAFLHQRAQLEGCSFQIYNKRLILFSEAYMESMQPIETLTMGPDCDYKLFDNRPELYGSCVVSHGQYTGEFSVVNSSARVCRPEVLGGMNSDAEAKRFAKALLRAENKNIRRGYARLTVQPGYAAGSTLNLKNSRAASWDGPVFLDHIRNDYARNKSKLFFRKPLEGY